MINFISDLDKTLVYSKQIGSKCVEYIDNREITYMTQKAYDNFILLLNNKKFNFIPCTLRDYSQTTRIEFIKLYSPKYMICDNGASIYVENNRLEKYDKYLVTNNIINKKLIKENINKSLDYLYSNNICFRKIKSNDDNFFLIIFNDSKTAKYNYENIKNIISPGLVLKLQNKKLYIIPEKLDKQIACSYLINEFKLTNIITAGDSNVDDNFVKCGDYIILPKHATFKNSDAIITNHDGIFAGEDIVNYLSQYNNIF